MNILSYSSPNSNEDIAISIAHLLQNANQMHHWWYFRDFAIEGRNSSNMLVSREEFQDRLVRSHLAYYENYIWPVFHGLPDVAEFNQSDRMAYHQFNIRFARFVHLNDCPTVIVDARLTLSAGLLNHSNTNFYWGLPWPKTIWAKDIPFVTEIAESLLSVRQIGFQIAEFKNNFLEFVKTYLPAYEFDLPSECIIHRMSRRSTKISVCPMGLDSSFWEGLASKANSTEISLGHLQSIGHLPMVLSVDGADASDGTLMRLKAIDFFFASQTEKLGKLVFVELCLPADAAHTTFDGYKNECRRLAEQINARWQRNGWQPILWLEGDVEPLILAKILNRASVLLVTSIKEGLNLIPKKFIACSDSGILLLPNDAASAYELRTHCLTMDSLSPETITRQLLAALAMSAEQRSFRLRLLKRYVNENNFEKWWHNFVLNEAARRLPQLPKRSSNVKPWQSQFNI